MNKMERKKGITLIALVITIIVLLILAGITISLIIDQKGIIQQAKNAQIQEKIAEITEQLEMKKADLAIEDKSTILNLKRYLEEILVEKAIGEHTIELTIKNSLETYAYIIVDNQYGYTLEQVENGDIKITYKGTPILVEDIQINKDNITMEINSQETLEVSLLPEEATNSAIYWESSNPEIATVENGVVKAIGIGECEIKATAINGIDKTVTCTVNVIYPTLASKAKIGDYVIYEPIAKTYTITTSQSGYTSDQEYDTQDATDLWQVLYNDSTYGLQITSSKSVGTLNLGTTGKLANARTGYNNVITTLNTMSNQYINEAYATSARSIGTNPSNPADGITSLYTVPSSWPSGSYTGFKVTDSYYLTDETAMKNSVTHSIAGIDVEYFLGSRYVAWNPADSAIFYIRTVNVSGTTVTSTGRIAADSDGAGLSTAWMKTCSAGVRPVVTLIQDIRITKGDGTKENPYILQAQQ